MSGQAKSRRNVLGPLAAGFLGVWIWGVHGVRGNDTGGVIPWAAMSAEDALAIAGEHCARYDKYAVITSVHPWSGAYIGFACRRAERYGPVAR